MSNTPTFEKPQTYAEYMDALNKRLAKENADQEAIAKPVLDALKAIPEISGIGRDRAEYAIRGGSVYCEVLHGRFTHEQLNAAYHCLVRGGAGHQIITEVTLSDVPYSRLGSK